MNAICPEMTRTVLSEANLGVRALEAGVSIAEMVRRRNQVMPLGRTNDADRWLSKSQSMTCD